MSAEEPKTQDDKKQSDSTKTSLDAQNETSVVRQYSPRPLEELGPRDLKRVARTSGSSRLAKKSEDRRRVKDGDLPRTPSDFVGASLADGRYEILGQLGKGSMAWVFRAADRRLETDVVVKIPKPEKLGDEIRERFQRESQLLVRLAHPHVVKVLDVGEHQTIPYVVMQLLSGGTLLDKMDETHGKLKRMSPDGLKSWLRGVAQALDFCGKQGTVHRDVKPANILFDDDNNAYVSDFGLTKIMFGEHTSLNSSETTTGIVLGTPNYIAPEIVLGKPYDGRADQYSLGITAYHALIGKAPMQGTSATVTMINQTQKRLQLLSEIRSDVPEALALVIRRCIEKDPELRFSSCEEFAEAAIDGIRGSSMSSVALSSASVQAAAPQTPESEPAKSAGNPRPKRKARRRNSSGSSVKNTAPVAADPLDALMGDDGTDWLDDAAEPLPPKRRSGKKKKSAGKKKKTASKQGFFSQLPKPVLLGGVAAILVIGVALSTILSLLSNETPEFDRPEAAEAGSQNPPAQRSNKKPPNKKGGRKKNRASAAATAIEPAEAAATAALPMPPDEPRTTIPWYLGDMITFGTPNSSVVVCGQRVWDNVSATFTATLDAPYAQDGRTRLSPNGRLFAASTQSGDQLDNPVGVWDVTTGNKVFTAAGATDRSVDVILLSNRTLFVGNRDSDELEVWDCDTGQKLPSVRCRGANFVESATALSHDGLLIATVADGRLSTFNARDGDRVTFMQNPAENPVNTRTAMLGDDALGLSTGQDGGPVFAGLTSLHFSRDNQHLAGYSRHPTNRMMCWTTNGRLIADHAVFCDTYPESTGNLQWFAEQNAWVVAGRVVIRNSGRVVITTHACGQSTPDVHLLSDSELAITRPDDPNGVSVTRIPWKRINTALTNLRDRGDSAILSRDMLVSTKVNLMPYMKQGSAEVKAAQNAIYSAVNRDGLKTQPGQGTAFQIRVAPAGDAKPIYDRMAIDEASRATESVIAPDGKYVVAELLVPGQKDPVWRVNLGSVEELNITDGAGADMGRLTARVNSLAIPYYIPRDPAELALPVFIR